MSDVTLKGALNFAAVSVEVSFNSESGKAWFESHFGAGAVSAVVPKSSVGAVVASLTESGLSWA